MKIKFDNGSKCYEVLSVCHSTDEKGIPVDIVITGGKETLLNIADEQGLLGFNIQQLQLGIETPVYEALYGRLKEFTCTEYEKATFGMSILDYLMNKNKNKMKTFARVKFCEGFTKALQSKDFPNLRMYCSEWTHKIESDGTIVCEVVDDYDKDGNPKKSLDIELALFDYFFNVSCEEEERERRNLWAMVNNKINREIVNIVKI